MGIDCHRLRNGGYGWEYSWMSGRVPPRNVTSLVSDEIVDLRVWGRVPHRVTLRLTSHAGKRVTGKGWNQCLRVFRRQLCLPINKNGYHLSNFFQLPNYSRKKAMQGWLMIFLRPFCFVYRWILIFLLISSSFKFEKIHKKKTKQYDTPLNHGISPYHTEIYILVRCFWLHSVFILTHFSNFMHEKYLWAHLRVVPMYFLCIVYVGLMSSMFLIPVIIAAYKFIFCAVSCDM